MRPSAGGPHAALPSPGLCGNFNSIQADDFRTISGLVEGTAAAFANTWKTQAACPNIKNNFEDPCSLSVENGTCVQQPRGPTWRWVPGSAAHRPEVSVGPVDRLVHLEEGSRAQGGGGSPHPRAATRLGGARGGGPARSWHHSTRSGGHLGMKGCVPPGESG